jgi:hypothetical protein
MKKCYIPIQLHYGEIRDWGIIYPKKFIAENWVKKQNEKEEYNEPWYEEWFVAEFDMVTDDDVVCPSCGEILDESNYSEFLEGYLCRDCGVMPGENGTILVFFNYGWAD